MSLVKRLLIQQIGGDKWREWLVENVGARREDDDEIFFASSLPPPPFVLKYGRRSIIKHLSMTEDFQYIYTCLTFGVGRIGLGLSMGKSHLPSCWLNSSKQFNISAFCAMREPFLTWLVIGIHIKIRWIQTDRGLVLGDELKPNCHTLIPIQSTRSKAIKWPQLDSFRVYSKMLEQCMCKTWSSRFCFGKTVSKENSILWFRDTEEILINPDISWNPTIFRRYVI